MNAEKDVSLRSPLADVIDFRCCEDPETTSPEETQIGFEITFVRKGYFELSHRSRSWLVDSRSIVSSNDGAAFRIAHGKRASDVCTVIRIDASLLREIRDRYWRKSHAREKAYSGVETIFPVPVLPSTPGMDLLHHKIFGMATGRFDRSKIGFEQHLTALVEDVVRRSFGWTDGRNTGPPAEPVLPHHMEVVERARYFMLEHFMEDLSIRQISNAAYISPYHFIRSFKAVTGETPYRYLRRLRLSNARFLLGATDDSVTRIALESGFSSLSHFSDSFSSETNISPTEYRRRRR